VSKKYPVDYRVNLGQNGNVISIEVTCCKRRIGELRYHDEQSITCPVCGARHLLRLQYNHFHLALTESGITLTGET